MAKSNEFRHFMKALKEHWRTVLPEAKPLAARIGAMPMASTFDLGRTADTGQHVYLKFITTWRERGLFTIDFVLAGEGQAVSVSNIVDSVRPGERFGRGAHRIGSFLADGEKWWHLCQDEKEQARRLGLGFRGPVYGGWTHSNYEQLPEVVQAAVLNVTEDVKRALDTLGIRRTAGA